MELYAAQKIATVPDDLAEGSCHLCSARLRLVRVIVDAETGDEGNMFMRRMHLERIGSPLANRFRKRCRNEHAPRGRLALTAHQSTKLCLVSASDRPPEPIRSKRRYRAFSAHADLDHSGRRSPADRTQDERRKTRCEFYCSF